MRFVCTIAILSCVSALARTDDCCAQEKATTTATLEFFEKHIRPLFVQHCYKCHGPNKQRGELRLDSAAAIKKGGGSGEDLIVAGHPQKSMLIKAVTHVKDAPKMPPNGKLPKQQIAYLIQWVQQGGHFPETTKTPVAKIEDGDKHWAFESPADPPIPSVKNESWPQSPIDHFILAGLEKKEIAPAPPADKRALIRRATFDLTGLPPTPKEIDDFLNDESSDAFAKVVDRLLSSPHYGEHWGRHWLDVARYADSNGLDENVAYGHAWLYRDYVVEALNNDMPYDQFLTEQIAGDLLPAKDHATRKRQLIATGFLALGPKVLAEVDEKKMEMDILDEQIDTFGRAFMGLTLGCARCHDHKFDPTTAEDYYALAGIFQSTKTMENFKKIARWHENVIASPEQLAEKAEHDAKMKQAKDEIQKVTNRANEDLKASLETGNKLPKNPEKHYPPKVKEQLKTLRAKLAILEKSAPELPTAMGATEGEVSNAYYLKRGNHLTKGKQIPRRFPNFLAGDEQEPMSDKSSGRLKLARWLTKKDHPLTSRVMVNRIWRWHFGEGIVRSVDNFGILGERPTNQALLDWLAHRFMEQGWSMKKIHKMIMLSSTYQMSSKFNTQSAKADPGNRLQWRFPIRRLEAEAIRDNILEVSGLLDKSMGGSMVHVKNREFFFNHTSEDNTKYDSMRRALYLPVVRNNLYDVFQLFDSTDAAVSKGDRATTTVATQALFMLNSELMAKASDHLANTLLEREDLDDAGRIKLLYVKAYGRSPTEKEIVRNVAYLQKFDNALREEIVDGETRRLRSWSLLCHVVMAGNEFVYVK